MKDLYFVESSNPDNDILINLGSMAAIRKKIAVGQDRYQIEFEQASGNKVYRWDYPNEEELDKDYNHIRCGILSHDKTVRYKSIAYLRSTSKYNATAIPLHDISNLEYSRTDAELKITATLVDDTQIVWTYDYRDSKYYYEDEDILTRYLERFPDNSCR